MLEYASDAFDSNGCRHSRTFVQQQNRTGSETAHGPRRHRFRIPAPAFKSAGAPPDTNQSADAESRSQPEILDPHRRSEAGWPYLERAPTGCVWV